MTLHAVTTVTLPFWDNENSLPLLPLSRSDEGIQARRDILTANWRNRPSLASEEGERQRKRVLFSLESLLEIIPNSREPNSRNCHKPVSTQRSERAYGTDQLAAENLRKQPVQFGKIPLAKKLFRGILKRVIALVPFVFAKSVCNRLDRLIKESVPSILAKTM